MELDNLTEEQRQSAIIMLQEEVGYFAKDNEDVGSIEGLHMNRTLSDPTSVQKTYTSVPRPLYTEVKHYIEDLLNRGWITSRPMPHQLSALERRMEDCAYVLTTGSSTIKQCETATQSQGFKRHSTTLEEAHGFQY